MLRRLPRSPLFPYTTLFRSLVGYDRPRGRRRNHIVADTDKPLHGVEPGLCGALWRRRKLYPGGIREPLRPRCHAERRRVLHGADIDDRNRVRRPYKRVAGLVAEIVDEVLDVIEYFG